MRTAPRRAVLLALAACLLALPLLASARPASAALSFCPPGSGAGQCQNPQGAGVATDSESGRVYVTDRGNNRIDVFKADGEFLFAFGWGVDTGAAKAETCTTASGCQAGIEGSGAGQFAKPSRIAVDNVSGSASRHDVYVSTTDFRVQKFEPDGSFLFAFGWGVDTGAAKAETCTTASTCQAGIKGAGECQLGAENDPIAVGPGGNVFVGDASGTEPNFTNRVEKLSPTGACLGETLLIKGNLELLALAVDSSEDAYVSLDRVTNPLRKYDLGSAEKQLCDLDPGIETTALALDSADRLFAAQREGRIKPGSGIFRVIAEYDPSCKLLHRFGYGQIQLNLRGLASYPSPEGDLFGGEEVNNGVHYLKIPPPGPIVAPPSLEADPIGNTKATIKAEINPEGKATSYHVDYMTRKAFEEAGDKFEGAEMKSTPTTAIQIKAGSPEEEERERFRLHLASAVIGCPVATQQLIDEGKCLEPETEYLYRVVATNADNPSGKGEGVSEGALTTQAAIELGDVYATEVGTDTATINAQVNPLGIPANGYFEYVTEAQFQASGFAQASRIPDTAGGEEPIDFGAAETSTTRSATLYPLATGTTYRYRLIATNPFLEAPLASKEGSFKTFASQQPQAGSCPANEAFRTGPSAPLPDCRAYEMVSPLDKANGDIVVQVDGLLTGLPAVLNQSAVSGGRLAYGSYRSFGDAASAPYTAQYISSRGAEGWSSHGISPPGAPGTFGAVFDSEFRAFSPDLCEAWITPFAKLTLAEGAIPGYRNLYRRQDQLCGGEAYEALSTGQPENLPGSAVHAYRLELQGLSADGEVAAFAANDSLEGSGAPDNTTEKSQLYAKAPGIEPRFVCVLPNGEASKAPCSAGTGTSLGIVGGRTRSINVANAVSADGTRIFWTAAENEGKIYLRENPLGEGAECAEAGAPCTIDVSKEGEALSKTTASHYWAASKDGSKAIFSTGGLEGGKDDLYEFDVASETTKKIAGGVSGLMGASEDATRVYFASGEVLSGEEENGAGDKALAGKANLYLHEAGAGSGTFRFIGTLTTADVNPVPKKASSSVTGFQPGLHNGRVSADGMHATFMSQAPLSGYDNTDAQSGKADTEVFLYDAAANGGAGELLCASCNPSGARPAGTDVGDANAFWVAARIPTFESTLYAPRVLSAEGNRLFFESQDPLVARDTNGLFDVYEWERAGTGSCDPADASFSAASSGCIDLISSGKGLTDSLFLDADPAGQDAFFTTLASLLPQDYGLTDIYDARAGGGFPPPPPPPPPCIGDACQSPAAPPNDPTPASASFRGAGNPAAKQKHAKKHKRHVKKHKSAKRHRGQAR